MRDIGEGLEVAFPSRSSSSLSTSSSIASEVREDLHTLESEGEGEAEEEGDGVGQLLRATVEELEGALEDTRQLLASRDTELLQMKSELDRYRQQAAREIANKTRLAQALDQSQSHTSQLEDILQGWQLEVCIVIIHIMMTDTEVQYQDQVIGKSCITQ